MDIGLMHGDFYRAQARCRKTPGSMQPVLWQISPQTTANIEAQYSKTVLTFLPTEQVFFSDKWNSPLKLKLRGVILATYPI